MDGTERIGNCSGIALQDVHGRSALTGVQLERFDMSGDLAGEAPFRDAWSLADRRVFIQCVRWLEESLADGRRALVVGPEPLRHALLLAVAARWFEDVEAAESWLGTGSTGTQRDAAAWALGLP
jgi:hypothetical protein